MIRFGFMFMTAIAVGILFLGSELIENESELVLTKHVAVKSRYLVGILEANAGTEDELPSAITHDKFIGLAETNGVAAIHLFHRDGKKFKIPDGSAIGAAGQQGYLRPAPNMAQPTENEAGSSPDSTWGTGEPVHLVFAPDIMERLANVAPLESTTWDPLFTQDQNLLATFQDIQINGEGYHIAQVIVPAHGTNGQLIGFVGLTIDLTQFQTALKEGFAHFSKMLFGLGMAVLCLPAAGYWTQKRAAEKSTRDLGYLSHHDALTGLLNRQTFIEKTEEKIASETIGYIGYVDVDRFKMINDTYGHNVGDAYLNHIAQILSRHLNGASLVARFGGDEFTFALPPLTSTRLNAVVEAIRKDAENDLRIDGFTIAASISMGVACWKPGLSLDTSLQQADLALYFAKSQGRNRVAHYNDEMGEAAAYRRELEAWLRKSCREKSFEVAFQPLVDAGTERTIGFEALLRLRNAEGAPISPAEFIPLAESMGLIEEIGEWVLVQAIEQISALDESFSVSVNLSAEQFKSNRLVGLVKAALANSGFDAKRLELEITESVLLEHNDSTQTQIDELKALGVQIAMDDFGTGFSSLSSLWRYGFDRIKIDKSFIQALEVSPERSMQLIDTMVLLAARMGMSITAEGIETEQQREVAKRLGCNVLQGFYYGHPKPLDHFNLLIDPAENPSEKFAS